MESKHTHYLEQELHHKLISDPTIFEFLQTNCLDGVFFWDLEDLENKWMSDNFWRVFGYNPNEKSHSIEEWKSVINPEDMKEAQANFKKHCENPEYPYDQVVRYRHKDGKTVWVRCRGIAIRDKSGKPIRMLGAHTDITKLKETELSLMQKNEELTKLARRDFQTSLYNRMAFAEIFEQQLLIAAREHMPISLAMIDIDHFKSINDSLGHMAGDKVLLGVAETLKTIARESDVIARFGGEEFIILMFNTNHKEAEKAAERLRTAVEEEIVAGTNSVTISIGLATFGEKSIAGIDITPSEIYEQMLGVADKALYRAKMNGRNQVCY